MIHTPISNITHTPISQRLQGRDEWSKNYLTPSQCPWVALIWWATTTWKTALSLEIAHQIPIEIISADSRQVYKYMDIGTDKVTNEEQARVPHHCLDIVNPDQTFTAGQWKKTVETLIPQIHARWALPVIVWWTGLYIDMIYKNYSLPDIPPQNELRRLLYEQEKATPWSLYKYLHDLDPTEAQKHHPHSLPYLVRALEICITTGKKKSELVTEQPVKRPLYMFGLWREKEDTNKRINIRIMEMMSSWLVDEVASLLERWFGADAVAMQGIWYKEIVWYIQWSYAYERAVELLKRNTHYLWKKQRTRFKRYIAHAKANPKENVFYSVLSYC
jgi:tRNA dimethylallyltransferase